ncbi:phycobiliprotein lyase [Nodosilinea sp. P-1105]|uniref:phycobiliprotein lyase n=1 Tax=Nodosilinea sp. P-1105 TaxID=2546229 RepID=UPI00146A3256|nr:phycobiliprotein lyase [Nodosilinea sp. P-1105]NMF85567.1 phycobiliprotein lyase [Nodosilinea sp. P-1105]
MNVMDFFRMSAGQWYSQRSTHHLPFRRAELGDSHITVEPLEADHPSVVDICKLHDVDAALAVGGALVTWKGAMAWDKEDENHEGTTVFALVPDADNPKVGQLLRERGYAEIVPVIGRYEVEDDNALLLTTEYETMSSVERFWFANPNLRLRTSVVKRFGGFSTASFCAESRKGDVEATPEPSSVPAPLSAFGW